MLITHAATTDSAATISVSPSDKLVRVGALRPHIRGIRVPYAAQAAAVDSMEELRLAGIAVRDAGSSEMPGLRIISEPGVGKTIAAETLRARVRKEYGDENDFRVLICRLDTSGSQASVPQSILKAAKKPRWDYGSPSRLWARALDCIDECETQMLVFDEIQRAARRPTISPAIVGDLQDLLDTGKCPLVFMGTTTADTLFDAHPTFTERLDASGELGPLDWFKDQASFIGLLTAFDQEYKKHNLTAALAGLDHPDIALKLWMATSGKMRLLARTLETALLLTLRDDRDVITANDLEDAIDDYIIRNQYVETNPFRVVS